MYRPFVAALSAVVLAGVLGGVADAKSHAGTPTAIVAESPATAATQERATGAEVADAAGAAATTDAAFTVSAKVRAELAAIGTASNMPSANADSQMWSAGTMTASRGPRATGSIAKTVAADPIHRFARGIISRTSSLAMSLTRNAMRFIGTPYVFGGTSSSGFDCSGYTQHVFAMLGITLPRTADAQFYAGHPTIGGIAPGDLVFFQTYLPGPSHVGIYIGGGRFIHSSSHGVRISALAESYWASRYLGAKRIVAMR